MTKIYKYSLGIVVVLELVVLIALFISDDAYTYKARNLSVLMDKEISIEVMLDPVSKRMEIYVINNSDMPVTCDLFYNLEILRFHKWKLYQDSGNTNALAIEVPAHDRYTQSVNMSGSDIASGTYRVAKVIRKGRTEGICYSKEFYIP